MNTFGNNLKSLRKQKDLRQDEIKSLLGFSRTTWSNYELGLSEPSLAGLVKISKFFGVTLDDLLTADLGSGDENSGSGTRRRRKDLGADPQTEGSLVMNEPEADLSFLLKEVRELRREVNTIKKKGKKTAGK